MATFEEQYRKYSTSGQGQAINDLYDAKKQSQLTQLESAYQASKSEAEAARDKLPGQYQQQANDLSAQYERNRRNFNIQAAGAGLNTGTASQAALAQNSAYQRDMGNLRTAQADAMTEADRGIAELERQYQANVSSAIADNDYQRAQALLNGSMNQQQVQPEMLRLLLFLGDENRPAPCRNCSAMASLPVCDDVGRLVTLRQRWPAAGDGHSGGIKPR